MPAMTLPRRFAPALAGLVLLLQACGPRAPDPVSRTVFRSAGAGIWSAAAFQPARIEGDWHQAAGFTAGAAQGCAPGGAVFSRNAAGGLLVKARLCLDGREVTASGPVTLTGPGRFTVRGMGEWWVIWVDSGYRTLAIATPKGEFGFVLDRGRIGPDRLRAAAEIFDFNGYAKDRLKPF
ncbi:lipocalin/fatty acid-binding family protein [Pseudogemmobacter bohemicus]|uniref:lipocalin family protein n=1 Tax=Pseudogemmobacter bohemicus TaxID=2250708 RepID=UPI001E4D48A4|nr:lipocalin family protein [Pseudogemmobacter bohemicus]